jgi:EmrB/QacA subfamily drug resistance transporter
MTKAGWTLTAAILGSSVVFLDSTVVNIALPKIAAELPTFGLGTLEAQSYIYNGYLLTLASMLILAGALSDHYGRRRIFRLGLISFGLTSLLCAISPNMEFLIGARLLQGVSGALLVPGALAIIRHSYQSHGEGKAFGIWSASSAATTIIGPFVGGFLIDSISWRSIFLLNIPLILVALVIAKTNIEESTDHSRFRGFDWLGAGVMILALGGLSLGVIYGEQRSWHDPLYIPILLVGIVSLAIFPFLMKGRSHALIPLTLFKSQNFTAINISTLLIYGALYAIFYYLVLFLQGTLGYSATAAGVSTLPQALVMVAFSATFGKLGSRFGPKLFLGIGPALMALGILLLTKISVTSSAWHLDLGNLATFIPPTSYFTDLLPALTIFGLGLSMLVAPLTTALMDSVAEEHAGLASAINNAISRTGPQLVGVLLFAVVTASFYQNLQARLPDLNYSSNQARQIISPLNKPLDSLSTRQVQAARASSTDTFHLAMLIGAALLAIGATVNIFGVKNNSRRKNSS